MPVQADHFASRPKPRVDCQHILAAQRSPKQKLAQIVREDSNRFLVRFLFGFQTDLDFDCGTEQALEPVLDSQPHLFSGGFAWMLDEERLEDCERFGFRRPDFHGKKSFVFAPTNRQQTVARDAGQWLAPIEIVLKLGAGLFLAGDNFRTNDALAEIQATHPPTGGRVVAHLLGEDITSSGQGLLFRRHPFGDINKAFCFHLWIHRALLA